MAAVREIAHAKINLSLHVLGRREDGYHLLESLVAFAGVGDELSFTKSPVFTLHASGPRAGDLPERDDNIIIAAANALAHGCSEVPPGATIELVKNLPIAAGIGGGSANAAACLRGLLRLADTKLSDIALNQLAVGLGADVPVCLRSEFSVMRGIGNLVDPLPALPKIHCVLVNPGVGVPTGPVFQALGLLQGAMSADETPEIPTRAFRSAEQLAVHLSACRNDLEAPAMQMVREIGDVQDALIATPGCLLARMSGSGATCFGLYAEMAEAEAAAAKLGRDNPSWWTAAASLR